MNTIELSIPDMQSAHCQARVQAAIKDIDGLEVQKVESGKLSASVEADDVRDELVAAIEKAGYKVEAGENATASSCSTGCCGN